jgi:hypothetical protein
MNDIIRKLIPPGAQYKKSFILCGGGAILLAMILLAVAVALFSRSVILDAALEAPYQRFELYRTGSVNFPSAERKTFLSEQEQSVSHVLSEVKESSLFFDTIKESKGETISPLKFKEELFLVKSTLNDRAREKHIAIPRDFGFSEWEKKIPPAHKLADLFQALDTAREIGLLAIDSSVVSVDALSVFELEDAYLDADDEHTKYLKRRIALDVTGDYGAIMGFMRNLFVSDLFFVVSACDFSLKAESEEEEPIEKQKKRKKKELVNAHFEIEQIFL